MEDLLQQKQEDLSLVVEPLVDSISELVLSTVTGAYENVQASCMDISDRTNKLVLIAQQVATASTDVELQMEVANAIGEVAVSIENLVVSFTNLLTSSNGTTQEAFAKSAKDVGDAINKLCSATDQTSQQRIISAVKEAIESSRIVKEAAFQGKERLVAAAQLCVEKTVRVVKVATLAAGATADPRKKESLLDGASKVKAGGPYLIQAAKAVCERASDPAAKQDLELKSQQLGEAYSQLINAAKLSPSYFGKLNETYEYIKKLIDTAKELEEAANNLYEVAQHGTPAQFVEAAKIAASKALSLVNQTEAAIRLEKDPVKKQLMKDAAAELREASQALIMAGKAYRENPNDPEAKARLEQCHRRLEAAIKAIVAATGGDTSDTTPQGKLLMSTTALESSAKAVLAAAKSNPAAVVDEAQNLTAIAMQVARDLEALAAQTTDPNEKKRLLAHAEEIKLLSQKVLAAAKKVAANPNDPAAQKELAEAHKLLMDRINQIRRDAHIAPGSGDSVDVVVGGSGGGGKSGEEQLVSAAKEEAAAALKLTEEAERLAAKIADPRKRQMLQDAIREVRMCQQRVVEAAELLAAKPGDPAAQQRLAAAQKDLGAAIQKMVSLTGENDAEVTDAMNEMKQEFDPKMSVSGAEEDIFKSAQNVLDEISEAFGNNAKKMSPEEFIANARTLSNKAGELAKQLREMAAKVTDPVYKEKLLNASKLIRDNSIQVKILSAVRAAGGEDKTNSVNMAAKILQTNIQDIIREVRAESLRTKFKSTVKQTMAINKVIKAWGKKK